MANAIGVEIADYLPFVQSEFEEKYLRAVIKHGSMRKAAKALNRNKSTIREAVLRVKTRAERRGFAPQSLMTNPAPAGFKQATSTLVKGDPAIDGFVLQWQKNIPEAQQLEMLREISLSAFNDECPRVAPTKAPELTEAQLANLYIVTDYHMGMKSDKWMTNADGSWDMHIAREMLIQFFAKSLSAAPDAELGIMCNLGDFLHWDGLEAVTPQSGHSLDADDRFDKLVKVTISVFRTIIAMMLTKHKRVHVIMAEGNHDLASSVWLRQMFDVFYEDEPRITVDTNPDPYYAVQWGDNSLFFHHGHKKRPLNVDDVFVAKFRDIYGQTRHSYAHMGHLHHDKTIESNLMTVMQHRTLASPDAYASRGGWMSGRSAPVFTYHKQFGQVGLQSYTPEMLERGADE